MTTAGSTPVAEQFAEPRPRVLVRATYLRAAFGDLIETRGRLSRPRSRPGWPLEQMLARRGIFWVFDAGGVRVVEPAGTSLVGMLTTVRGAFEASTRAILPEPHASLVAGIVLGARVGLPADLRAAMSDTGTSHLTAVSGANVAMVSGGLLFIAIGLLGRGPASLVAVAGVWLYTLMVGAPPSALRAATMATFALTAYGFGRQPDAIGGLALAVAVLLGWDPGLASDLGFQLSVAATAGLILLSPSIERWLGWIPKVVRGHVAIAIAAQIATLPLLLGTFQRLSLVSLPANVLAAPTIVPIMGLGASIALVGWVPGLDVVLGWAAWVVTGALLLVIETAASLPGAVVAVGRAPWWLPLGWYALLGCWVAAGSSDLKALGLRPDALKAAALSLTGLMAVLLLVDWSGVGRPVQLEIVLLDTEPAAAFVRTPGGRSALLTTSTGSRGLVSSVGAQLELSERAVDVAVGPGGVRTGAALPDIASTVLSAADEEGSDGPFEAGSPPATAVEPGTLIDLGDGVRIEVVDVRLAGQRAVVDLAIVVDGVAVLLPGPGAAGERWNGIAPDAPTVAVVPSNALTWARALAPRNWLLLVGEATGERARGESAVPFLPRREHGAVEISIHSGATVVRTERCQNGRACEVQMPPARFLALHPALPAGGTSDVDPAPVQSGRTDDGR